MELSIIIPVYNVERYIQDCLNSIYKQNNSKLPKFEVICIDDKGNDKSIDIIQKYIKDNAISNLKLIYHEANKGLSEARNTGLRKATGKYICFLDSDDMIHMNQLEKMLNIAMEHKLDILEGDLEEISETKVKIDSGEGKHFRKKTNIMTGDKYFTISTRQQEYFPMACCRIYRTNFLKDKYFFIPGLKFEDEEFSPKVIINANKVMYCPNKFYIYRRRDDSITTNMAKNNQWVESYFEIIDSLFELSEVIKDKESYEPLKERIANIVLSILKNPIAYGTSNENLQKIVQLIKEKEMYKIPQKSKNLLIKAQGYLMKYPKLFIRLYKVKGK